MQWFPKLVFHHVLIMLVLAGLASSPHFVCHLSFFVCLPTRPIPIPPFPPGGMNSLQGLCPQASRCNGICAYDFHVDEWWVSRIAMRTEHVKSGKKNFVVNNVYIYICIRMIGLSYLSSSKAITRYVGVGQLAFLTSSLYLIGVRNQGTNIIKRHNNKRLGFFICLLTTPHSTTYMIGRLCVF